jgi:ABC-type dipeptide/oligopeptide/nickel transport system permease component
MGQYVIKRLLLMIPVLLGISILTFGFMRVLPGDVLDVMYAGSPLSIQDIAKIRHQLGMDKPMPVQYWDWISGLARLDAGKSLWTRRPVLQEIADRLPSWRSFPSLSRWPSRYRWGQSRPHIKTRP